MTWILPNLTSISDVYANVCKHFICRFASSYIAWLYKLCLEELNWHPYYSYSVGLHAACNCMVSPYKGSQFTPTTASLHVVYHAHLYQWRATVALPRYLGFGQIESMLGMVWLRIGHFSELLDDYKRVEVILCSSTVSVLSTSNSSSLIHEYCSHKCLLVLHIADFTNCALDAIVDKLKDDLPIS